jgi:hypothetical protein
LLDQTSRNDAGRLRSVRILSELVDLTHFEGSPWLTIQLVGIVTLE